MRRYKNIPINDADKMSYRELLNRVIDILELKHPNMTHQDIVYIAELMVRWDEDIIEVDGNYCVLSEYVTSNN